jgi:hypothetical protein
MSPKTSPAYPTIASVMRETDTWTDLSERERRAMKSALAATARLAGKPPEAVQLDPGATIALYERATPAQLNCSRGTFRNYRSANRKVLRRLGLLASRTIMQQVHDPVWQPLVDGLPAAREFMRLRGFVAYCASNSIAPEAVTKADLEAYCAMRAEQNGGTKQHDQARRIADLWRRAIELVANWPTQPLLVTRKIAQSLPISAFPATLAPQVNTYLGWLAGEEEGADTFLIKARSPRTVDTRADSVRRILHGALQSGIAMGDLSSLDSVLSPPVYRPSMRWHLARKPNGKPNADTEQLGATLVSIATFRGLNGEAMAVLRRDVLRLKAPPRTDVTPRLGKLLDQLEDPLQQAKLLHLPQTLMAEAKRLRDGWVDRRGVAHAPRPIDAAFLAGVAVAIEIELLMPVRLENLTHLRLGVEVQFPVGRKSGAPIAIRVAADQVKNKMAQEVDITGGSAKLVHRYLNEYRPLLPNASGEWLFPGQKGIDLPRNQESFGRSMMDAAHSHAGIQMNPHAYRGFVASLILDASPGDMETVRCALGHRTTHTAGIYYKRHNSRRATARVAEVIQNRRQASAPALAADKKMPRKVPQAKPGEREPRGKVSGSTGNLRRGR